MKAGEDHSLERDLYLFGRIMRLIPVEGRSHRLRAALGAQHQQVPLKICPVNSHTLGLSGCLHSPGFRSWGFVLLCYDYFPVAAEIWQFMLNSDLRVLHVRLQQNIGAGNGKGGCGVVASEMKSKSS